MVIDLGLSLSGTAEITLPEAFDGDDLQLHLLHEVILPAPETTTIVEDNDDDGSENEEDSMPGLGVLPILGAIGISALTKKKRPV